MTATAPPASPNPTAPQGGAPPSPLSAIALNIAAPASAAVNDLFSLTVTVANAGGLFSAPFVLTYDPAILEFVEGSEGNFLKSDGKKTVFQVVNAKQGGRVTVNLSRIEKAGGVSGSGSLASLAFRAKGRGVANLGFSSVRFTDAGGKALDVMPFNAVVSVK